MRSLGLGGGNPQTKSHPGVVNPIPGPGTEVKARFITALAAGTPEHVSWSAGDNITELVIFAQINGAAAASSDGIYAIVAIDAATEGEGVTYVTQAESKTSDIQWIPIPLGKLVRIPLTAALSQGPNSAGRVTVNAVGDTLDVWIGGY